METKLAAIRLRGIVGMNQKVESTLSMLRLHRKNYCVVLPGNPVNTGMLKKIKDYITWGETDDNTFKTLVEKRGQDFSGRETDSGNKIKYNDFMTIEDRKIIKYFRLNAPRKGLGRKGLKHTFKEGGALGYRGEKNKRIDHEDDLKMSIDIGEVKRIILDDVRTTLNVTGKDHSSDTSHLQINGAALKEKKETAWDYVIGRRTTQEILPFVRKWTKPYIEFAKAALGFISVGAAVPNTLLVSALEQTRPELEQLFAEYGIFRE